MADDLRNHTTRQEYIQSSARVAEAFRVGAEATHERMGECPRCGDRGLMGCRCEDCGCDDYKPRPW